MFACAAACANAQAAGSCSGTVRASLVSPLPSPLIVHSDRVRNPELARKFSSGMKQGGVALSSDGNASLTLVFVVSAPPSGSTVAAGTYRGLDWAGEVRGIRSAILS